MNSDGLANSASTSSTPDQSVALPRKLLNRGRESTIAELVKETHADAEKVRRLYDAALSRLASQTRVKTYASVVAANIVRAALERDAGSSIN